MSTNRAGEDKVYKFHCDICWVVLWVFEIFPSDWLTVDNHWHACENLQCKVTLILERLEERTHVYKVVTSHGEDGALESKHVPPCLLCSGPIIFGEVISSVSLVNTNDIQPGTPLQLRVSYVHTRCVKDNMYVKPA